MSLNEQQRRNLISKYCEENPNKKKIEIITYFKDIGFKKSFIYKVIQLIKNNESIERKPGSGQKSALSDSKQRAKLKSETAGRTGKSYRELGKKYQVHKNTIKKHLQQMNIERKAKKHAPTITPKQHETIKTRLRALSQNLFAAASPYKCVMDDESYFTVEGNEWQPKTYYESPDHKAPDKAKYIYKTKFPAKVLMWLAISEHGISEPVFFKGGLAVTGEVYQTKCIPVLHNFIKKYHGDDKIVFWPDLASAHYANATLAELNKRKIEFVPKEWNPPNVPQLRPIETFWANLKRVVYRNGYRAKNVSSLIVKIRKELKKIDTAGIQKAMREVPRNVRKAKKFGVDKFL